MITTKIRRYRGEYSKEYILSIPKTINENGCWIPSESTSGSDGYSRLSISGQRLKLHRVVMCLWHNIDYDNKKIETRHSEGCDRACFNYEHLTPGSASDNCKDTINHHRHFQTEKENCPKCQSEYRTEKVRRYGIVSYQRYCPTCRIIGSSERYFKRKNDNETK